MNRERNIEVLLHHDEWKCMRILHEKPAEVSATVDYLAERTGWKPRHIADVLLKSLVKQGYLRARSFEFTAEGEQAYNTHLEWWLAILWKMRDWKLDLEILQDMADRMLDDVTPEFIAASLDKMEFDRMREDEKAGSEQITESDFQGILRHGSYRVEFSLLNLPHKEMSLGAPFPAALSEWNARFSPIGRLLVEPLRSRLEISWQCREEELLGVSYLLNGQEHYEEALDDCIPIYLTALQFERVPTYKLLDGEAEITLHIRTAAGEQRVTLQLVLPILYV